MFRTGCSSPDRDPAWLVAALSLLAAAAFWSPAFFRPQATGNLDWTYFHGMWEAGFVALTRYGEWPLWNPYHCGGASVHGNPQSQLLSPLFLLALPLGPTIGLKVVLVLHAWAGAAGMYLLGRSERLSRASSLLAASVWSISGFFAGHMFLGHAAYLPFFFAPCLLLAWRAAPTSRRCLAAAALMLFLTLLEGGVYPFLYFLLMLAFESVASMSSRKRARRIARTVLVGASLTILLSAVRILPVLEQLARFPRTIQVRDRLTLAELLEVLTARSHDLTFGQHAYVWPGYSLYVGWAVLALAVAGVFAAWKAKHYRPLLGALLFLSLTLGNWGELSPYHLLKQVPVYDSLRQPATFRVIFSLYLALLAAHGFEFLCTRLAALGRTSAIRDSLFRRAAALLVAAIIVDLWSVQWPVVDFWNGAAIARDAAMEPFRVTDARVWESASFPQRNITSRRCYEPQGIQPAGGLWVGKSPQVMALTPWATLDRFERTTATVSFRALLREPGRVLINQNAAPGWSSNVGSLTEQDGLLAVDLPVGESEVRLGYSAPMLVEGGCLTLLGLVLTAVVASRPKWSDRARA